MTKIEKAISEISGESNEDFAFGGIFNKMLEKTNTQFSLFNVLIAFASTIFKMWFIYFVRDKVFYFKENVSNNNPNILFENFLFYLKKMKFSPYFILDNLVTGTKGFKNTYLIVNFI